MTTNAFDTKEQYLTFRKAWAKAAQDKNLSCTEHLLFNLLLGRPITHGFTPVSRPSKLANGHLINAGLYHAAWRLQYALKQSAPHISKKFSIAMDVLDRIEVPEVRGIEPNFGEGKKMAKMILMSDKPLTFADLEHMMMDEAA